MSKMKVTTEPLVASGFDATRRYVSRHARDNGRNPGIQSCQQVEGFEAGVTSDRVITDDTFAERVSALSSGAALSPSSSTWLRVSVACRWRLKPVCRASAVEARIPRLGRG